MRGALVAALIGLTACGGTAGPVAPTTTIPVVLPVTVNPGAYVLTISLSTTGVPTCTGGAPCFSVSLCSGTPDATSASFDVDVARDGSDLSVVAGTGVSPLTMRLNIASIPATGSISGSARDPRGIAVDVKGTLTGTGSKNPAVAASGSIDGQVTLGGGSCSNNGHGWSLAPR